ncbi:MAG: hypothetical protein ABIS35_08655 [Terracoccus sp.]
MTDERPSRRALPQRYTSLAPFYDLLSAEWPVYRVGREIGIPRLGLGPGSHALDVGAAPGSTSRSCRTRSARVAS